MLTTEDYDGDGEADLAVFRPSNGFWFASQSDDASLKSQKWGANGDKPVIGDYDGDGTADLTVYRPAEGVWYIFQSSTETFRAVRFGLSTDVPV